MGNTNIKIADHFLYGGDYNPDQWLDRPDILEEDIRLMKEAHVNCVTLGVFAWSALEPKEGVYQLDWLAEIIDHLYENEISVIMATPSGARPKWLADKYPEVLRTDENRRKQLYGARHNHCFTSPIYRQKVAEINTKLAERFKDHPAVILWHISNEFGGECHCKLCQDAFHQWLKKKYGTPEKMNKAWWSAFWSHVYDDFSDVESPSSIGENGLHGLVLDWKRFTSDQNIDYMKSEIEALRKAKVTQPVTTNFMYDIPEANYTKMAKELDIISWDTYPTWHKYAGSDMEIAHDNGMQHDFMRSLLNKPFLLMESCPSSTNWQPVSKLKKPGLLHAQSMQAIAHGAESVLYFQIRQSLGSSEKFHGALIDHYGKEDTRVFQEAIEVGKDLEVLSKEILGTHTRATAALVYDVENRWAMEESQGPRNDGLFYAKTVLKMYKALKAMGFDVDVIDSDKEVEGYEIVACPMLYMLRSDMEKKLNRFVHEGGILIGTYFTGVVDENDLCFMGGTPFGLREVFGLRTEEIDGLYEWEEKKFIPVKANDLGLNKTYTCKNLFELEVIDTAEVLMTVEGDFYDGHAAVTKNSYGKGYSYMVCGDAEEMLYRDIVEAVVKKHKLSTWIKEPLEDGLILTTRESEDATYLFLQNFSYEEKKAPKEISEECIFGDLKPFGTAIYKVIKE